MVALGRSFVVFIFTFLLVYGKGRLLVLWEIGKEQQQRRGPEVSLASVSHSGLQHGEVFAKLFKGHLGKKGMRIVMVGLATAGRTTILHTRKLGEIVTTRPTTGFNMKTVEDKDISFTMWDMGSQDKIRPLWHHYCQNTQGLIFVTDSSDPRRAHAHAGRGRAQGNKQEHPIAVNVADIMDKLGLPALSAP